MKCKILFLSVLSVILFLTTGCLGPVKAEPRQTYTLNQVPTDIPQSKNTRKTLLVTVPRAESGYETSKMAYVKTNPYEIHYFSQNRWVASPANLMLPLFVDTLQKTGAYHAVVSPPFSGLTDLRLDTDLILFQQDFSKNPSQVTITLRAQLVDSESQTVISMKTFTVTKATMTNDPAGGVKAANQAMADLLRQVAAFAVASSRA